MRLQASGSTPARPSPHPHLIHSACCQSAGRPPESSAPASLSLSLTSNHVAGYHEPILLLSADAARDLTDICMSPRSPLPHRVCYALSSPVTICYAGSQTRTRPVHPLIQAVSLRLIQAHLRHIVSRYHVCFFNPSSKYALQSVSEVTDRACAYTFPNGMQSSRLPLNTHLVLSNRVRALLTGNFRSPRNTMGHSAFRIRRLQDLVNNRDLSQYKCTSARTVRDAASCNVGHVRQLK